MVGVLVIFLGLITMTLDNPDINSTEITSHQLFIQGSGILVVGVITVAGTLLWPWPWKCRRQCADCHKKTSHRDKTGVPLCEDCDWRRHQNKWTQEAADEAKNDPPLMCPTDGTLLIKGVIGRTDMVVDRCPHCKGMWLSPNNTTALERLMVKRWIRVIDTEPEI